MQPLNKLPETDLILNADGSAYHINLLPEDIASTIITVGDPERVKQVSKHFDHLECTKSKREFITHVGTIGKKRFTVISTGIGTDNIDIVLNEIDALINVDLNTRILHTTVKSLEIIRIGTSGAIQPDILVDSLLVSTVAIGLDPLLNYYKQELSQDDAQLLAAFTSFLPAELKCSPYIATASNELLLRLADGITQGITLTAPGFYAPQGRVPRGTLAVPGLLSYLSDFNAYGKKIANLERETAGIYGLANILGHRALSFNIILANRITQQFSKHPEKVVNDSIQKILEKITG
jgi:uridine phosphorylase